MTATGVADREIGGDVRLAVEAMATRFELVLPGSAADQARLRTIGEEALAEIVRLETRLSAFDPASDVSWINAHASERAVKVEPRLFALLRRCAALSAATDGAFDITVGPLMRAWKFTGAGGALPAPAVIADARTRVGCHHLEFDLHASTIRFRRPGMGIDLGAAGKGYAIDEAVAILRAHRLGAALLHGGTSSIHALGHPVDGDAWRVAWEPPGAPARIFALHDSALSVSAVHGKAFWNDGRQYGHVMNPRTGTPTFAARSAVVTGPLSFECDVLSTALLVLGEEWLPMLRVRFPGYDGSATR